MTGYFDSGDLRCAVREGRAEDVRGFLRGGADVETEGLAIGSTLLHEAASANKAAVIDVLLEAGAEIEAACAIDRLTPLHAAAERGGHLAALALLKGGADVNRLDKTGRAPIHLAALGGHASVVTALLKAGADVSLRFGHLEYSALGLAACHGRVDAMKAIVAGGGNVNEGDSIGYTALHYAAATNKVEIVTVLLSLGADIEGSDTHGMTPLHFASAGGHTEAAVVLLDHGANVHALDSNNDSPLHWAACPWTSNSTAAMTVHVLLERGADETLINYQDNSPADLVEAAPPAWNGYMHEPQKRTGEENNRTTVLRLLLHADADRKDRTWRRRRLLVLCRTCPERVILNPTGRSTNDEIAPSTPTGGVLGSAQTDDADVPSIYPHRQRSGDGCDAGGGEGGSDESSAVIAWVVGLDAEDIFRAISGFL